MAVNPRQLTLRKVEKYIHDSSAQFYKKFKDHLQSIDSLIFRLSKIQ